MTVRHSERSEESSRRAREEGRRGVKTEVACRLHEPTLTTVETYIHIYMAECAMECVQRDQDCAGGGVGGVLV